MKQHNIPKIDVTKYKPEPFQGIMDEREDDLEYKTLNIIFNDLTEPERNLLIASVELGNQSKLAEQLNVSSATISLQLKKIKEKIKNKLKEK